MAEATGTSKGPKRTHTAKTREVAGKLSDTTLFNSTISKNVTARNRTILNDTHQTLKVPGKKNASRVSLMPPQQPVDIQKKIEDEKKIELGLLYNEYLEAMMVDLIVKKKAEEKKQLMAAQLATVAQEIDQDTEKLIKITRRERDIISLSLAQKEIDEQLAAVTKYTKNKTFKSLRDVLSKLQNLLEPLDVLRCNGIVLPQTEDEWKDTQEVVARCSNTLQNITKVIGSNGKTFCAVNTEVKSLAETYKEIEILQKKLEEALCHLQMTMLKNASLFLTHNEND